MKISDLHNDFLTCLSGRETSDFLFNAKKSGVKNLICSVYTSEMKNCVLEKIEFYKKLINEIKIKPKTMLHIEDCGFIKTRSELSKLIELKPFSCGLTWNFENRFAGGALSYSGLTSEGKHAVKEFENNGIVLDLAHLNKRSFYDVLKCFNNKVFCSHAAFSEMCKNKRNIDRFQIKEIIKRGGIIGLSFVGQFLNDRGVAGFEDVFRHIHYFLENFGDNNLCLGTDFYGTKNTPVGLDGYKDFNQLYAYLHNRGISKQTLNRIFHSNFEEFFKKQLD